MNEITARGEEIAPPLDSMWQGRLDALIRGECTEDEFMRELSNSRLTGSDSAWSVVALLDQRFRRGQMPVALFRSIESKIARRELGALDYGTTIELPPVPPSASSPAGSIEVEIDPQAAPEAAPEAAPPRTAATPRTAAPPQADPHLGRILRDRYVLEGRLGNGGAGNVFRAVDRYRNDLSASNRLVAIKFLHDKADAHPEALPNLRREFYCSQGLSHPNIVKVYELDRDSEVEFFTMEFLEGELLSRAIERVDPLAMSRSRAWSIIREVAAGLAYAHSRDVVHGDLKPQNIMITNSGQIRILAFGARGATRQPPANGTARPADSSAATPAYASCDVLEGQRADARDDLFALACITYELLAGQHPFQRRRSTAARDLGLAAPRPRGLTGRQWRALSQGLAWRREDRSISVRDWIAKLHPERAADRRATARKAIAAALVFGLAFSAFFNRQLFDRKAAAVSQTAAGEATAQPSPPAPPAKASAGVLLATAVATAAAPSTAMAAATASPPQAPQPRTPQHTAKPAAVRPADTLSIAAPSYRLGARKNFAEIHVRRSNGSGSDTSFAWWTEPSTAQPGADYVPQARTVQMVSGRSRMASLFVKLVPTASRTHQAVFNVVIAEPGNGASLGRVTRTAVVLPAQ